MVSHMVSRTSSVVVSPNADLEHTGPVAATLHGRHKFIKPARHQSEKSMRLQKLFELGQARDNDDMFADIYCRTLQTAVRGNAWRTKRMENELAALRKQNAAMRAAICAAKNKKSAVQKNIGEGTDGNKAIYQGNIIGANNTMRKCGADARDDAVAGPNFPHTA